MDAAYGYNVKVRHAGSHSITRKPCDGFIFKPQDCCEDNMRWYV